MSELKDKAVPGLSSVQRQGGEAAGAGGREGAQGAGCYGVSKVLPKGWGKVISRSQTLVQSFAQSSQSSGKTELASPLRGVQNCRTARTTRYVLASLLPPPPMSPLLNPPRFAQVSVSFHLQDTGDGSRAHRQTMLQAEAAGERRGGKDRARNVRGG